jgi:hypothetical protein
LKHVSSKVGSSYSDMSVESPKCNASTSKASCLFLDRDLCGFLIEFSASLTPALARGFTDELNHLKLYEEF